MARVDPPIKVMVVDDDEGTLAFFRRQMSAEPGIEVAWVVQEDEAVASAEAERPNVVVVDGGFRGRRLIELLAAALPRTKVLSVNGLLAAAQAHRSAAGSPDSLIRQVGPAHRLAAAVQRLHSGDGPANVTLGLPPTTELVTHFQAVHDLHSGDAVTGFEALMRWGNQGALVPPGSFLPLVEAEGRVTDYDHHVVRAALTQLSTWRRQPAVRQPQWVSVNLSGINLRRPDLSVWVAGALRSGDLEPSSLVIEFDHAALSADLTVSARRLGELRELGGRTAIDNVVTGPAGLGRVAALGLDIFKVGRGLTHQLGQASMAKETMQALLQATANRGWPCIATGVQDDIQLDTLRSMDWQFAQGHALSNPMTAFGCEALLAEPGAAPA